MYLYHNISIYHTCEISPRLHRKKKIWCNLHHSSLQTKRCRAIKSSGKTKKTSTLSSLHLNKSNQTWPNLISYCWWPNKLIKCTTMKAFKKCRNIYLLSAAHHQAYWIHLCQDHIRNYHIKYTKFQQHLISSHLPKCKSCVSSGSNTPWSPKSWRFGSDDIPLKNCVDF